MELQINLEILGVEFNYDLITYINEADFFECENENHTTDIYDREFKKVLENIIISELNIESGYLRVRQNDDYKYYNFKFEEKTNKEILATNTLFLVKEKLIECLIRHLYHLRNFLMFYLYQVRKKMTIGFHIIILRQEDCTQQMYIFI